MSEYKYTYGSFASNQIAETKTKMRKQIFFLLLLVDPSKRGEYHVDVREAFENILTTFGGLNALLNYPTELVEVMALIYAAFLEYKKPQLNWGHYRKLILDAGNLVQKIKEVSDDAGT